MVSSPADAIFWIAVACCAIAQVAIIRSVVIGQSRALRNAGQAEAPRASVGRRAVELAWAVLPGIALAFVFLYTWRAMHDLHIIGQVMASARP